MGMIKINNEVVNKNNRCSWILIQSPKLVKTKSHILEGRRCSWILLLSPSPKLVKTQSPIFFGGGGVVLTLFPKICISRGVPTPYEEAELMGTTTMGIYNQRLHLCLRYGQGVLVVPTISMAQFT